MLSHEQIKTQIKNLHKTSSTRLLPMAGRARLKETALLLNAIIEHNMTEAMLQKVITTLRETMTTPGLPEANKVKLAQTIEVYELVLNDGKLPSKKSA